LIADGSARLFRLAIPPGGGGIRVGRVLRALAVSFAFLALLTMVAGALYIGRSDTHSAFGLACALAVLPVPALLAAVVWADRMEPEPPLLLASVFAWGAGAALVLAYTVNTAGGNMIGQRLGYPAGELYVASVSAPIVEETLKAVPLLAILRWGRDQLDDPVDGIVYAAMAGLGFAMSENILFYGRADLAGGLPEALDTFLLRGVASPFLHPLFTSATGLAVVLAATRGGRVRWALPLLGLAVAALLHSTWNTGLESVGFDLVYFGLFVPLLVGVVFAIRHVRRQEARVVTEYLPRAMSDAPLLCQLASPASRRRLRALAHKRAGAAGRHAAATFEHTATELAFLQRRLECGWARVDQRHEARRAELRRSLEIRLARLRALQVVA
jgi:RsiW-degrading membrane proteinase PrsW (M82 family)